LSNLMRERDVGDVEGAMWRITIYDIIRIGTYVWLF
jgi:hypothetical protein